MQQQKDYPVGYGKPPLKTRFKPGNREHLKRRKKDKDEFGKSLRALLAETVQYKDGRKTKRARRIDLQIERISVDASNGDIGAADLLLTTYQSATDIGDLQPLVICFGKRQAAL
jgi:hypothetical protein